VISRAWLIGLSAILAGLVAVRASAQTDPLYEGLRQRGLESLAAEYLKKRGGEAPPPVAPLIPVEPGGAEAAAKATLAQAASASGRERDAYFDRALQLYHQAVAEADRAYKAVPESQWDQRAKARFKMIELRRDAAQMVFITPDNWLIPYLQVLEVSDRSVGDREGAVRILRIAVQEFEGALQEAAQWLSEIDRDPNPTRYVNAGYVRKLQDLRKTADFHAGWAIYYLGWALPADFKPEPGGRSRDEFLNDAITQLMPFTDLPDTAPAKYYAYLIIGQAQRELGKLEDALTSFAHADQAPEKLIKDLDAVKQQAVDIRIQVTYETALTRLKQKRYREARDTAESVRGLYGAARAEKIIYGVALEIVAAESLIAEAEASKNGEMKQRGLDALKRLMDRGGAWPQIVNGILWKLGGGDQVTDPGKMEPFQLWIAAGDAFKKARDSKKTEDFQEALKLYDAYATKVGPADENYPMAFYSMATIRWQLGQKGDAAALFQKVADSFPKFKYAGPAAQYHVATLAEQVEKDPTDANRAAYEAALAWFCRNWIKEDPSQQYNYAVVLYRGKKYIDAAAQFARVPRDSDLYPNARYWVPLCHLEQFRETVLPTKDRMLILPRARAVADSLVEFARYAADAAVDPTKKREILGWAQGAYVSAAVLYMDPDVDLSADALKIILEAESKMTFDPEMRGRLMKMKIDAYVKLGDVPKAEAVLDDFLKVGKPEEIGAVLVGLFQVTVDEVGKLVQRGAKDAAAERVNSAVALSKRLTDWLETSGPADKQAQIENVRYEVAGLYLAVQDYNKAIDAYQQIGGPKPWPVEPGQTVKIDCVKGLAQAYEGMGNAAPDQREAKKYFQPAFENWGGVLEVVNSEKGTTPETLWDTRYHYYYCMYKLGQAKEVRDALQTLEVLDPPLGGKDPVMQMKFRELRGGGGQG